MRNIQTHTSAVRIQCKCKCNVYNFWLYLTQYTISHMFVFIRCIITSCFVNACLCRIKCEYYTLPRILYTGNYHSEGKLEDCMGKSVCVCVRERAVFSSYANDFVIALRILLLLSLLHHVHTQAYLPLTIASHLPPPRNHLYFVFFLSLCYSIVQTRQCIFVPLNRVCGGLACEKGEIASATAIKTTT